MGLVQVSVLTATGVGVRRHRRWILSDVDVAIEPGELAAIVGPAGSGRTTLLLALADRFALSAGRIDRTGTAALGHVPGVNEPEPVLTVAEHVRERLLLLGRSTQELDGLLLGQAYDLDRTKLGRDLSPYEKHLLGIVLARLANPGVILADDVDAHLDRAERDALWDAFAGLAERGIAVVVTCRELPEKAGVTEIRTGEQP
jgi:ABC-2 type transport system ATP-binding protein